MKGFIEITLNEEGEKVLINVNSIYFVSSARLKGRDFDLTLDNTEETYESIKSKIERAKK